MKTTIAVTCILAATFSTVETARAGQTLEDLEREGIEQCAALANKMFSAKASRNVPKNVMNFTSLATWRASCAEKPPMGPGNVTALCEGDARTHSGEKKRVFFWEKSEKGKKYTGYYWCEQ
ncbi:hypothetical protein [Geomonas ferrireducens]|uniref:hypothetical protein n=1 Tax=Geomonas ferrireducens TaxID=2570227 RepID=UPI0010A7FF81|nr:hypothetical protein [Geomonas ferrireducens]